MTYSDDPLLTEPPADGAERFWWPCDAPGCTELAAYALWLPDQDARFCACSRCRARLSRLARYLGYPVVVGPLPGDPR